MSHGFNRSLTPLPTPPTNYIYPSNNSRRLFLSQSNLKYFIPTYFHCSIFRSWESGQISNLLTSKQRNWYGHVEQKISRYQRAHYLANRAWLRSNRVTLVAGYAISARNTNMSSMKSRAKTVEQENGHIQTRKVATSCRSSMLDGLVRSP